MKVFGDKIIVKPFEAVDKTEAGIVLVKTAQQKPFKGTVIETGKGYHREPMEIKVGDVVVYSQHAGLQVTENDVQYLVMRQSDILLVDDGKKYQVLEL
jgi:chaperonin GroES